MASSSSPETVLQDELKDAGNRLLMLPSFTDELLNLLDKVEHLLSRVEQAPSRPMQDALLPAMKALIAQELLRHSDIDVKVSVASCINEITRVTAPDAPYDEETMKEIFKLSVTALEKLSLSSGRCYTKAVSILDTIAKVRSCLVMLDLECDELIVEMFQLFLNTIRSDHPHSVFSDMESIMTLVIEESEEISLELLIPLLNSVKKDNQNVSPLSCKLGENVLKKCAARLQPYLPQAVQFLCIDPNDLAEIVFSICQDESGREHPLAKELAPDVNCLRGSGPSVDGSSRSSDNDSTAQMRIADTLGDERSLKTLEHCQSKCTGAKSKAHPDYTDSTKAVNLETEMASAPKRRGRKPNSLIKPEEGYDHSWLRGRRKALELPHHGENIDASPSQKHCFPDESHCKRGRPRKKGNLMNPDGDLGLLSMPKGDLLSPQEKASQPADIDPIKESKVPGNLKAKSKRGSSKSGIATETDVQTIPAPDNVAVKEEDVLLSDPERKQEASASQMGGKKQHRGNTISVKQRKESSGKKKVSFSATRSLNKAESQLEEGVKRKCKRKRTPREDEVIELPGGEIVGCKIKVWWPLDRKFYEGAVSSFDPVEKKHAVLYADGDEETLDLSRERWLLVGQNNLPEQGQEADLPSSDALSDMPQKKKEKSKSGSSTKQENAVSSSKRFSSRGGASGGKSKVEGPKDGIKSADGSTLDTCCLVDEVKGETCETYDKLNDEEHKSKTATPKTRINSQCDNSQSSKGENTPSVSVSCAVDAAKQKNILSEEALSGDAGKIELPDSIEAQESEMRSGKKRHRKIVRASPAVDTAKQEEALSGDAGKIELPDSIEAQESEMRSGKRRHRKIVRASPAFDTAKQENVLSEEALSGDAGKGEFPDSTEAQESEMRSGKKRQRKIIRASPTVDTIKQENTLSEEALSGDVGEGKLPDSTEAQESEMRGGKKRHRWDKS